MFTQIAPNSAPRPVTTQVTERAPRTVHPTVRSLKTDRLYLTALNSADLDGIKAVFGNPDTARMTACVPSPLSDTAAQAMLRDMMLSGSVYWAIRLPEGRMVGVIGVSQREGTENLHVFGPNLSVYIDPAFQGRGYACEAIDALLNTLRAEKRHRIVHAAHFADNEATARTLINAGFLYTGRRTSDRSLAREGEQDVLHMIRIL